MTTQQKIRTAFERLEELHNKVGDSNFVWYPFVFLRPPSKEKLTFQHRLLMTVIFSAYAILFVILKSFLFGNEINLEMILYSFGRWLVFFFLWFNFVTAFFWNRRARRLSKASPSSRDRPSPIS